MLLLYSAVENAIWVICETSRYGNRWKFEVWFTEFPENSLLPSVCFYVILSPILYSWAFKLHGFFFGLYLHLCTKLFHCSILFILSAREHFFNTFTLSFFTLNIKLRNWWSLVIIHNLASLQCRMKCLCTGFSFNK